MLRTCTGSTAVVPIIVVVFTLLLFEPITNPQTHGGYGVLMEAICQTKLNPDRDVPHYWSQEGVVKKQTQIAQPIDVLERESDNGYKPCPVTRSPVIRRFAKISASLDLTEDNVKLFSHIFDTSVGMTGVAELAEVDGPFVKIRLKGRFWHERSLVLARLGNYLKERIPEILEVDIEDEKQLDDSPENF
ncbi:hypothetical protein E3N88_34584 [Mikania micrantha]|uniref:Uncharacterized protein n=3 Tax=Heliantheae alliance TaxID=911341 RepID=A0A5N6LYK1_9ASTR|nr:hypothetical protein E3N88_34584 [Mikania micrantha]